MKISELTGEALDRLVAQCLDEPYHGPAWTRYSTDWAQGGPLIEREGINLENLGRDAFASHPRWCAWTSNLTWPHGEVQAFGHTPLIAAMRCYVESKLGGGQS